MNKYTGRAGVRKFSIIVGAGILGLVLGDPAGAIAANPTASTPPLSTSAINRAIPGAKTGMLKTIKDNSAQINNMTYPLAPGLVTETDNGRLLSNSPGWEKHLRYPVLVQYWLGQTGITQMIVFVREKDGARPQR